MNAAIRPMSSPATSPLGRISDFLGLLGLPGGEATVETLPPASFDSLMLSCASPLVYCSAWPRMLDRVASSLSFPVEPHGSLAILAVTDASSVFLSLSFLGSL